MEWYKWPDAAIFYAKPSENTNITRVAADDIRHSSKIHSSVRTCFCASLGVQQTKNLTKKKSFFLSILYRPKNGLSEIEKCFRKK